MLYQIINL